MIRHLFAGLIALLIGAATAEAHSSSSSYLKISVTGPELIVQWSIAIRDLDYAVGLDTDGDGAVSWGELRSHSAEIDAYALARLKLNADGQPCVAGPVTHLADSLGDSAYAVLRFTAACQATPHRVGVHYALLFDLDPTHRGLLNVTVDGVQHAASLSPQSRSVEIDASPRYGDALRQFFGSGIEHLLTGIDHLLFVTMLLLPAVYYRPAGDWKGARLLPVAHFRAAFIETLKVLSAFTLAHGISLTLSVLHILQIPQWLSEAGIALTILITAIDNIRQVLPRRRWPIAFGFGLIHGLGFANALGPLTLPPMALAVALMSFNLGLEAAQILVAAVVLPFGFLARSTWLYSRWVLPAVSGVVALLAVVWFADRAAGLNLMPF